MEVIFLVLFGGFVTSVAAFSIVRVVSAGRTKSLAAHVEDPVLRQLAEQFRGVLFEGEVRATIDGVPITVTRRGLLGFTIVAGGGPPSLNISDDFSQKTGDSTFDATYGVDAERATMFAKVNHSFRRRWEALHDVSRSPLTLVDGALTVSVTVLALPDLEEAVRVSAAAMCTVQRLEPDAAGLFEAFEQEPIDAVRNHIARELFRRFEDSAEAAHVATKVVETADTPELELWAAWRVGNQRAALRISLEVLDGKSSASISLAALALAEMDHPRAEEALRRALLDGEPERLHALLEALGETGTPDTLVFLERIARRRDFSEPARRAIVSIRTRCGVEGHQGALAVVEDSEAGGLAIADQGQLAVVDHED